MTGGAETSAPCFASTARHEVVVGGRKLVGSAQRRTARALLQQGSVLLGLGHLRLADFLRGDPAYRALVRDELRAATVTAGPWLGEAPPLERWADALRAELGAPTHLLRDLEGARLLTVPASHSYTPADPR
jgi:lipoate-protein ligase A